MLKNLILCVLLWEDLLHFVFSTLFPNARMMFMFIPFPIKAKYLFPIIILGSLYLGLSNNMDNIAHFAHIGGAIVGFILAKIWGRKLNQWSIG